MAGLLPWGFFVLHRQHLDLVTFGHAVVLQAVLRLATSGTDKLGPIRMCGPSRIREQW